MEHAAVDLQAAVVEAALETGFQTLRRFGLIQVGNADQSDRGRGGARAALVEAAAAETLAVAGIETQIVVRLPGQGQLWLPLVECRAAHLARIRIERRRRRVFLRVFLAVVAQREGQFEAFGQIVIGLAEHGAGLLLVVVGSEIARRIDRVRPERFLLDRQNAEAEIDAGRRRQIAAAVEIVGAGDPAQALV